MYLAEFLILLFNIILLLLAIVLFIPITILFLECLSAVFLTNSDKINNLISQTPRPRVAVVIPAHNEALGIEPVLLKLLPQITEQDRLIVIADNCTDNTAKIASNCGAEVIERHNLDFQGKGYALDYGLNYLKSVPPEVVVIIDADCLVQDDLIDKISRLAIATDRPIQSLYLLEQPISENIKNLVSTLAFIIKNWVRPLGLKHLELPCLLTGTGMAFSWSMIQQVSLASSNLVEDMQLSVDLAIAGYPTLFYPDVRVTGVLPEQQQASKSQRTRWEHGHLKTLVTQIPQLIKAAIFQKRFDLLALALDLSIPPLSLLVIFWFIALGMSLLNSFLGNGWMLSIAFALQGLMIFLAISTAWSRFYPNNVSLKLLLAVPLYIFWKIPIYVSFLFKPQTKWIRTERNKL